MAELYPPGCVLSCRPSPGAARWLRGSPALRDFLSGEPLAIAGNMPLVVSRGAASPASLDLLAEAGFVTPRQLLTFADSAGYLALLAELAVGGARFALSHAHLPGEIPDRAYAVARPLLCHLNNKRHLDELAPGRHRPAARLLARVSVTADHPALAALPLAIKAAVDEPTGGGTAVRLCTERAEVVAALAELESCAELLVEEHQPHETSCNIQAAITPAGEAVYLGVSEQVVTPGGRYRGNWLLAELAAPAGAAELALEIARAAGRRGYCGILGLDVAADQRRGFVVFDLNFRLNGSTPALLLAPAIAAATGARAMRYRTFEGRAGHAEALAAARRAMRAGWLVPLNSFDPALSAEADALPWLSGLVLGADRAEVGRREDELLAAGLE
jgi:hypothetical protein